MHFLSYCAMHMCISMYVYLKEGNLSIMDKRSHPNRFSLSLHQMYRNGCLEKCLSLGEQLEARDLVMVSQGLGGLAVMFMFVFQDVHFRAVQFGNEDMAERAKHVAEQLSLGDQLEGFLTK